MIKAISRGVVLPSPNFIWSAGMGRVAGTKTFLYSQVSCKPTARIVPLM